MILADKITMLRKRSGWSQDELAEKMNVSRQSVSKWESAQSIPDINKILEIARLFGVSTDYLLKDEQESVAFSGTDEPMRRTVSLEEANSIVSRTEAHGKSTALGVVLCILSPVALILLAGYSSGGRVQEGIAVGIGLILLFALVAVAVALFIIGSVRMRDVDKLKKQPFELSYGVGSALAERLGAFLPTYTACLVAGVILCILSPIPLIVAGLLNMGDLPCIYFTCLLFVFVAMGVYLLISASMKKGGYDLLLKDGEYDPLTQKDEARTGRFAGVYWPLATAIYLGVSFFTGRWDLSWIVWPVAALLFVAISAAIKKGGD